MKKKTDKEERITRLGKYKGTIKTKIKLSVNLFRVEIYCQPAEKEICCCPGATFFFMRMGTGYSGYSVHYTVLYSTIPILYCVLYSTIMYCDEQLCTEMRITSERL